MLFLKHKTVFPTVLIILGITLLTIGLVKGHLDAQADLPLSSPPYQGEERGEGVMTAAPSATPIPPAATPTAVPSTPKAVSSTATSSTTSTPTLRLSSVQASTPTVTLTPTSTEPFDPSARLRASSAQDELSTGPGPPPASAPPDRIVSPAIGLDAPVVPVGWMVTDEGPVWDAADYAAGWHQGSTYPGHVGNTVLSGHHNIKGKVFRYLIDLEPDDEVFLYVGDTAYHYVVTEKHLFEEKGKPEEVRRANAQWIAPTDDERLTLVTCWPYTSNTHRLIIVAKPVISNQ